MKQRTATFGILFDGMMKMRSFIKAFLFFLPVTLCAQTAEKNDFIVMPGRVLDGDTVLLANIKEVYIFPKPKFTSRKAEYHYWKLVRDLRIVYPYARLAKVKLDELNREFVALPNDKARKEYAKKVEKQLRAEYEDQLKSLTITQGKLLIKLIDRETGKTSYTLVKELRGSFQAAFWQTVAVIFGSSLKVNYDPNGKDAEIEKIVRKIELGYL